MEAVKALDPDVVVEGEELLVQLLEKIAYLEEEANDNYFYTTISMPYPESRDTLTESEVLFEGTVSGIKYLENVLIGGEEAVVEYDEAEQLYNFTKTLTLEDGYHQIRVEAISQSGKNSDFLRPFYIDTTPPEITVTPIGVDENGETTLDRVELIINVKDNFGGIVLYEYYDSWYEKFGSTDSHAKYITVVDETITYELDLDMGVNTIVFRLKDAAGWWAENVEVIITRTLEEVLETIQEKLLRLKNDLKDNLLYGEPTYNTEARNKVNNKLIELGLNPKEFKITIDPFDANGNKRVQIFHEKSDAAIGFYFKKAKPVATITSLIDPATLTVEVNDIVEMPEKVTAKMSDGTQEEVLVTWDPDVIDTSISGTKEAIGTVEDFDGIATFTVIVEEAIVVEEIQEKLIQLKNDLKDYLLSGVPTYNTEARNKVKDKLIELGLDPKEFNITIDPFNADGNKRVQIFHNKSEAAIGFYFKKI